MPPFPGMDPWLEDPAGWPDVHLRLLLAISDQLVPRLRPRYIVRADERVVVDGEQTVRPDLAISATRSSRPRRPGATPLTGTTTPVVVPTVLEPVARERFLTVVERETRELVAVIEVLSPTNKRGPESEGRQQYLAKRSEVLASDVHLVEVDLLRAGQRVPMAGPLPTCDYCVVVSSAARRPDCDVYAVGLRDRLPVVALPLRGDEAVALDLQAALEDAYARAGYEDALSYDRPPVPALAPDDLAWARERLAAHRSR